VAESWLSCGSALVGACGCRDVGIWVVLLGFGVWVGWCGEGGGLRWWGIGAWLERGRRGVGAV